MPRLQRPSGFGWVDRKTFPNFGDSDPDARQGRGGCRRGNKGRGGGLVAAAGAAAANGSAAAWRTSGGGVPSDSELVRASARLWMAFCLPPLWLLLLVHAKRRRPARAGSSDRSDARRAEVLKASCGGRVLRACARARKLGPGNAHICPLICGRLGRRWRGWCFGRWLGALHRRPSCSVHSLESPPASLDSALALSGCDFSQEHAPLRSDECDGVHPSARKGSKQPEY